MNINTYLTPHFQLKEFIINNENYFLNLTQKEQNKLIQNFKIIAQKLEDIRLVCKKPITISSGFRSVYYNKKVGGRRLSFHLLGLAVDITFSGISSSYYEEMKKFFNGVIYYPNKGFYHLDIRSISNGTFYDIDYSY